MTTTLLVSKHSHSPNSGSTKAAATTLIASTAEQYDGLELVCRFDAARALFDILVNDVIVWANQPLAGGAHNRLMIPLRVPSGASVKVSAQAESGGSSLLVTAYGINGGIVSYARCDTYGADTINVSGSVVDGGGAANTEQTPSSTIVASTSADTDSLRVSILPPITAAGAGTTVMVDIGHGSSGTEVWDVNDILWRNSNGIREAGHLGLLFPVTTIVSGSRLAARCQADGTDANGRTAQVIIHALSSPYSNSALTPLSSGLIWPRRFRPN